MNIKKSNPRSSWGSETMKFKVDKKNNRFNKELIRCSGELCKNKPRAERKIVNKDEECASCYDLEFKKMRFNSKNENLTFDSEFLTRFNIV
jgi:hypothetical protein